MLNEAARFKPAASHLRLFGPAAPPEADRRIWLVEVSFEDGSHASVHCDWSEGQEVDCFEIELQARADKE